MVLLWTIGLAAITATVGIWLRACTAGRVTRLLGTVENQQPFNLNIYASFLPFWRSVELPITHGGVAGSSRANFGAFVPGGVRPKSPSAIFWNCLVFPEAMFGG